MTLVMLSVCKAEPVSPVTLLLLICCQMLYLTYNRMEKIVFKMHFKPIEACLFEGTHYITQEKPKEAILVLTIC